MVMFFNQIGLERLLSEATCRGEGTIASAISTTLSGHMISKWGVAMTTPVVVASVTAMPVAATTTPALLVPLLEGGPAQKILPKKIHSGGRPKFSKHSKGQKNRQTMNKERLFFQQLNNRPPRWLPF
jgi:hypothetical protein